MKVSELVGIVKDEMVEEKMKIAKGFMKEELVRLEKAEKFFNGLKDRYDKYLDMTVNDLVEGIKNDNIRF